MGKDLLDNCSNDCSDLAISFCEIAYTTFPTDPDFASVAIDLANDG